MCLACVCATPQVLFASLQGTDAFVRQPYHQLRHPMIFYYGHPAVLYINKFRVAGLLDEGIDQFIEQVCGGHLMVLHTHEQTHKYALDIGTDAVRQMQATLAL